jgi:hypothetical protein
LPSTYEAKVGLISLLTKYRIVRTEKTPDRIEFDPKSQLAIAK